MLMFGKLFHRYILQIKCFLQRSGRLIVKNDGFEHTRKVRNFVDQIFHRLAIGKDFAKKIRSLMIAKPQHRCNLASVESAVMMASELCVEVMVLGYLVCVAEL